MPALIFKFWARSEITVETPNPNPPWKSDALFSWRDNTDAHMHDKAGHKKFNNLE